MEMNPTDYGGMNDEQPINVSKGFENPLYDSAHQESLFSDPISVEKPQLETVMTHDLNKHQTHRHEYDQPH